MKLRIGAAAFVLCYFLYFAGPGVGAPFSGDDLMNLHRHLQAGVPRLLASSFVYWSDEFRPLGGLFYVALYRVLGFHPLPFRIACFLLLTVNLLLVYAVSRSLSGSREVATLATLIMSFHAWFVDLYYSTGTVYDILCFLFYFSALALYARVRQSGRQLRILEWAAIFVLYVCALDSKEMAVTLPLALLTYELLYHWPFGAGVRHQPKEVLRALLPVLALAAFTVPYAIGKLASGALAANPAYLPDVSFRHFLHGFNLYTNILLYVRGVMRSVHTALVLAIMLELALLARSRTLVFCWCFVLFSTLPFIFIPHWSGFFLYIPMFGWALYAATALVTARDALFSHRRWASAARTRTAVQALTFAGLALILAPLHAHQLEQAKAVFFSAQLPTRAVTAELARVQPHLPHGARVLFLNDTFPDRGYWLLFLVRLQYHDLNIEVQRRAPAQVVEPAGWDVILAWHGARLCRLYGTEPFSRTLGAGAL